MARRERDSGARHSPLIAVVLIAALAVTLAGIFPFRQILAQNRQVENTEAKLAALQAENAALEAQIDALKMLEEALAYRPLDVKVNQKAAELCLELREFDKAREYADTLCDVEPGEASSHVLRARVLRCQGLREKAREALDRATELDPNHPDVAAELAQLRKRGRR